MDFILTLHRYTPYVIVLVALVAAIWGLVIYLKHQEVKKGWRNLLIALVAFGVLQGLLGLTMVLTGKKPGGGGGPDYLHYVYGGIVALGLPLVWLSFTTNGKQPRKDIAIYSLATFILVLVALRAWMTGYLSIADWIANFGK